MTTSALDVYTAFILRYRWAVIALAAVLMVALAAGVRSLEVDNDYRALFNEDDPRLAAFDALERTYTESNSVLIAIAPSDGETFSRETLGVIEELTEAAWKTPHSIRVDSLTNYVHSRAEGDELIVEQLVQDAGALTDADLARIEEVALGESEIRGSLVSSDGRCAGLSINLLLPENSEAAALEITDYLDSVLDRARSDHPNTTFHMTGYVIVNRAMAVAVKRDLDTLFPIILLVTVGLTWFFLRSVSSTIATVAVVVFSMGSAMGFVGWSGMVLTPASSGIPIIVMVIAIADSIHLVRNTLSGLRRGLDKNAAIAESMNINAWPVFLTSLTTSVGFLSLNASDAPPFQVLGNAVAFGVACALVYSLTLLPALLSVLPLRGRRVQSLSSSLLNRLADFVVERQKTVLAGFSLVAIVLVAGIPRIEFGDNLTRFFDESYEVRRDSDFIVENLTGLDKLEYSLESGREGGITEPEYLRKVEAFASWFRQQPEVSHVQAFTDIMKRLNRNLHGDDPDFYRLPNDPELAAQYLLLYELSLPFGRDLNDRINIGKSATRMAATVRDATSRDLREVEIRAQEWLRANAPSLLQEASGLSTIVAYMTQRNIKSMLLGTIIAMGLISLILIGVFRSLRIGLISFLPNFIPAFLTLGLWGHLVGRIGIVSSVVLAVVFGIIVDDTIHFLTKYLRARKEELSPPEAVRSAFRTVGPALWTTTAVLSAGFLVFVASGFELSWVLGLLVAITIMFALATDFLLLPILLMTLDRKRPTGETLQRERALSQAPESSSNSL